MDKKNQKQLTLLNAKLQKLQQRLSGAKQQCDDPGELRQLEQEVATVRAAIDKLQAGGK